MVYRATPQLSEAPLARVGGEMDDPVIRALVRSLISIVVGGGVAFWALGYLERLLPQGCQPWAGLILLAVCVLLAWWLIAGPIVQAVAE